MEPSIIKLDVPNLSEQTITDVINACIELHDNRLSYKLAFYCDELSDSTGIWDRDVYREFDSEYMKVAILGTTLSKVHAEERWKLCIHVQGDTECHIYFENEDTARVTLGRIRTWLYS